MHSAASKAWHFPVTLAFRKRVTLLQGEVHITARGEQLQTPPPSIFLGLRDGGDCERLARKAACGDGESGVCATV